MSRLALTFIFALGCGSVPTEIDPVDAPPAECRTGNGWRPAQCLAFEGAELHLWSYSSTVCVCAADLDRVTVHGGRR